MVEFRDAILSIDVPVAQRCADIQSVRTFSHNDALIGATALVHDLTLVTRNVRDFDGSGVRIVNPWEF